MPHSYKLTYFNLGAIAEPIRWIFKYANVPFEDVRLESADWAVEKQRLSEIALGQMPILEVDGAVMTQSLPIARFICSQLKLVAEKPILNYRSDEVIHIVEDCRLQCRPVFGKMFQNPKPAELEAEIQDLAKNVIPKYMKFLEKIVGATTGPYIAGEQVTVGDFVLCSWLDIFTRKGFLEESELDKYANLKGLKTALMSNPAIKEWIETRPKTTL